MPTLTQIMRELGYQVNEKGVCWGFVCKLSHAIFCGEKDTFYKRLDFLYQNYEKTVFEEYKNLSRDSTWSMSILDMIKIQLYPIKFPSNNNTLNNNNNSFFNNDVLNQKKMMMDSLFQLFDGIALHQDPDKEAHHAFLGASNLAQVHMEEISKVTASVELEKRGFVKMIPRLTDDYAIYNITSLQDKLNALKNTVERIHLVNPADKSLSREIVFAFSANEHSINICYHPITKEWVIDDLNLGKKNFQSEADLAVYLITSNILFNIKDQNNNEPAENSEPLENINPPKPPEDINLRIIATTTGDYTLIAMEARPEIMSELGWLKMDMTMFRQKFDMIIKTIKDAIRDRDDEKVMLWLDKFKLFDEFSHLAPSELIGDENTPILHFAILVGNFSAFQMLIKAGLNLMTFDDNGNTPMHLLCKLLSRSANASIEEREVKRLMPLIIATKNPETLFFMQNNKGETPFRMALESRNTFLLMTIMLNLKGITSIEDSLKVLHLNRKVLTDELIAYLKDENLPEADRKKHLEDIYAGNNALGIFLNTPKDSFGYFLSRKSIDNQKVTGSIQRLHKAFPKTSLTPKR